MNVVGKIHGWWILCSPATRLLLMLGLLHGDVGLFEPSFPPKSYVIEESVPQLNVTAVVYFTQQYCTCIEHHSSYRGVTLRGRV